MGSKLVHPVCITSAVIHTPAMAGVSRRRIESEESLRSIIGDQKP
jgi:hypothetical protein